MPKEAPGPYSGHLSPATFHNCGLGPWAAPPSELSGGTPLSTAGLPEGCWGPRGSPLSRAVWQGWAWGAARGQVPGMQGSRQARYNLVTLHGLVGAFLEPLCSWGSCGHCQRLPWAGTAGSGHVGVFLWGRGFAAGSLCFQGWPCHCCLKLLQPLIHLQGERGDLRMSGPGGARPCS